MGLANKFHPPEYFHEGSLGCYQLLPFSFNRLSRDRYVLVNLVGESIVVSQDVLKRLVAGSLVDESSCYQDLKSKHFLMDSSSNVAIDLLAIKYRTKQHSVSQFTGLHIFVVTLRCDYTCKYCQVSRQMESVDQFDMTESTADRAIEFLFQSPSKSLKVEFQGGEPLLNFSIIKYIVERCVEKNKSELRDLQFVITTNLSGINEEVILFCKRHDILISTSLDGPEELHNKNRPRPGKDGYKKTIDGIRLVKERLGSRAVSALMTTTAETLKKPKDVIDEYVRQGLKSIFLRPLSPYGFALKTKEASKYNSEAWMKFYQEGLDYIIELNRSGYALREQYASIILHKIFNPSNPGYVDLQSPAGIGISAVVYNYDGDVYASDEARMLKEMGDERFRLGNVNLDSYDDVFLSENLLDPLEESIVESVPMCSDCGYSSYCGADPVYHYATQGDFVGKKPLSFFCKKNMSVIDYIFELLEDDSSRIVLESWLQ